MKPVKIVTFASLRPDLISLQYRCLKLFMVESFEYIVFNNAVDDPGRRSLIDSICQSLGIECIHVGPAEVLGMEAGKVKDYVLVNGGMRYIGASNAFSWAMNFAWRKICTYTDSIVCVIDSDMFPMKPLSLNALMAGYDFMFTPQYRGLLQDPLRAKISYPWTGLLVFDIANLPQPETMVWDCGDIGGIGVDPGGFVSQYLNKWEGQLNIAYLEFLTIVSVEPVDDALRMHCMINGGSNFFVTFKGETEILKVEVSEPQGAANRFFPHEIEDDEYVLKQALKILKLYFLHLSGRQTYPQPTSVDFLGVYDGSYSIENTPLIFHYKGASNYSGYSIKYNEQKTNYLYSLLEKVSGGQISHQWNGVISNAISYYKPGLMRRIWGRCKRLYSQKSRL